MEDAQNGVDGAEIAAWDVVFMARKRTRWWDRLCAPGFRHVCAIGYDPAGGWLLVDPGLNRTRIVRLADDALEGWYAARRDAISSVVHVETGDAAGAGLAGRVGYWCTTSIKRVLGFPSGALRPEALRRDLLRAGCEERFSLHEHPRRPPGKPGGAFPA